MLGNELLNIQFAKYHIWNNKSKGFPNRVLSNKTFNQSVCTEYSEAVNVRYTFQPLWVLLQLSQVAYNDIKWIKDKALWSKNIKPLYMIGLRNLPEKAHFSDVGIVCIIRQRLLVIELQRSFSEMNNDIRKDPNQSNKMRTYRKVKTIDN